MTNNSDSAKKVVDQPSFSVLDSLITKITNKRDKAILQILLHAGVYPQELIELKHKDFDFEKNTLTIRKAVAKNNSERTITLPENIAKELSQYANKNDRYFFRTKQLPQLNIRTISRTVEKYAKAWNTKVTTKSIQRTFRTAQLEQGNTETLGLKRFDKKTFLEKNRIHDIQKSITSKRDILLFDLLYETGCTVKELLEVRIKDIDLAKKTISFRKRVVKISSSSTSKITSFASGMQDQFLFQNKGKPLTRERVFQILREYNITARTIRNSSIAHALQTKPKPELETDLGITNLESFHLYGSLHIK